MTMNGGPTSAPTSRKEASNLVATWASGLAASVVVLVMNLRDLQPPMPWAGADVWNRWATRHEPDALVAALLVPVALVLVCVVAVGVLGTGIVVVTSTRRGRTVRCSERWPTAMTSFVTAVALLSGGNAAASTGSGASAGDDVAARPVAALVDDAGSAATTSTAAPTTAPTTTAAPTPGPGPSTTVTTPLTVEPSPQADPPPVPPGPTPARGTTVEVRAGDNLWRIAERQVAADVRRGPVLRYWLQLIELNRSRFVEPGNPSLILPGQVLDLPQGQ